LEGLFLESEFEEVVRIRSPISNHVIPAQAGNQNTRTTGFPPAWE
jgi:hypothetical protein